jgi:hypothetical protein
MSTGAGAILRPGPAAADDPPVAKATPPKAAEPSDDLARLTAQRAHADAMRELHQLDKEAEAQAVQGMEETVRARMAVIEAQARLQQVEVEAARRAEHRDKLLALDLDILKLQSLVKQGIMVPAASELAAKGAERQALGEQPLKWDDSWPQKVLDARRSVVMAEERLNFIQRQIETRRERIARHAADVSDRLRQTHGAPAPPAADHRRLAEIEHKLEDLLREVRELRRRPGDR